MSVNLSRNLFGILATLMSGCLFAQQTFPDSLTEDHRHIEILLQLVNENMNGNVKTAIQHAESAMSLAKAINSKDGVAQSCYFLGQIYGNRISDFKNAIYYHEKSIALALELKDLKLLASNYSSAAMIYYRFGFYGKALELLLASLDTYEQLEDPLGESFVQAAIALIYSESAKQPYPKLMATFERVLNDANVMKSDSLFIAATSYYTSSLIAHGQFSKAEKLLNVALTYTKSNDHYVDFLQVLYLNLGDIFLQKGIQEAAIEQYELASELCIKYKMKYGEALTSLKLGKAYFHSGQTQFARDHFNKALQGFTNLGVEIKLIEVYDALALLEIEQNQFENALKLRFGQLSLKDSLYADQGRMLFDVLSLAASEKVTIEQKDEHINWLSWNLIFLVLLVACFLGLVYLNHQQLRGAKYRSALVSENLLLEKELQNKQLQEEKLMQKLEFNAKALTANTLNLIQKNEILAQIREKAEAIKDASPENLYIRIKDLQHAVNFGFNTDKNWENFAIYFEQVHNNFFDQLKSKYPHLNSSDLKFCALLKLNLDTKEIAMIMNISPQSVKVARSRLRKKLQLGITSNLSSFITQI